MFDSRVGIVSYNSDKTRNNNKNDNDNNNTKRGQGLPVTLKFKMFAHSTISLARTYGSH